MKRGPISFNEYHILSINIPHVVGVRKLEELHGRNGMCSIPQDVTFEFKLHPSYSVNKSLLDNPDQQLRLMRFSFEAIRPFLL